jgi:hypothetical protein
MSEFRFNGFGPRLECFPGQLPNWKLAEMGHPYPRKLEPDVVWVQKRFIVSECKPSMELGGQTGGGVVLLTFNLKTSHGIESNKQLGRDR